MAKFDDKFIEKLTNFTDSLEDLVEILKEQVKNNPSEILNKLVDNFDGDRLNTIAKDVSIIKKNVQAINKNTDKILEVVKEQKDAKETGIFNDIEKKSNKEKITGAIKTVVLIAAGVLAIGMAFKIVGDVDFMSVMSLSLGILIIANAFAKVSSIKDDNGKLIDLKRASITSAIMLIMAGSILVSGVILSYMPILSIGTILSIVGVGFGVGLASYLLLSSFGKLKLKEMKYIALAPIIFPLISLSLVYSAIILKDIVDINFMSVVKTSVGIGLAIIAIMPGIIAINKMNMNINEILLASFGIVVISAAIVIASYVLSYGKYDDNYPSTEWSLGVGLSIVAFSIPMVIVGMLAMNGVGLAALAMAMIAIPFVVATIVATSLLLPYGTYDIYPSAKWSLGVGLSLLMFSVPVIPLGLFIIASFGLGLGVLAAGLSGVLLIAESIQLASHILSKGIYSSGNYPSIDWAGGVGGSIMAFAKALQIQTSLKFMSFFSGDVDLSSFITTISSSILLAGMLFNAGGDYWKKGSFPSTEWAGGVGGSIMAFAKALQIQEDINNSWFSNSNVDLSEFIKTISKAIIDAGKEFTNGGKNLFLKGTYPTTEWSKGVAGTILSFSEALKNLDDADVDYDDLSEIMKNLSNGIIEIGKNFSINSKPEYWDLSLIPNSDWISAVKDMLKMSSDYNSDFDDLVIQFKKLSEINWENTNGFYKLALAIKYLSKNLNEFNSTKIENFLKIGSGFQLISLVDNDELEDVLETIEDKTKILTNIFDDNSFVNNLLDKLFKTNSDTKTNITTPKQQTTTSNVVNKFSPFESKLLTHIEKIDENISILISNETEIELNAENVEDNKKY